MFEVHHFYTSSKNIRPDRWTAGVPIPQSLKSKFHDTVMFTGADTTKILQIDHTVLWCFCFFCFIISRSVVYRHEGEPCFRVFFLFFPLPPPMRTMRQSARFVFETSFRTVHVSSDGVDRFLFWISNFSRPWNRQIVIYHRWRLIDRATRARARHPPGLRGL